MKKNNLDEMQEQAMLRIEHNGCWLAFWGLLAAMVVQCLLGMPGKALLGEWVVFMGLGVYIVIACLRHGIWDRRLKADWKTNLIASAVAAIAVGIFVVLCNTYVSEPLDMVLVGIIPTVFTFVLCFAALSLCTKMYKNRRKKLDQE